MQYTIRDQFFWDFCINDKSTQVPTKKSENLSSRWKQIKQFTPSEPVKAISNKVHSLPISFYSREHFIRKKISTFGKAKYYSSKLWNVKRFSPSMDEIGKCDSSHLLSHRFKYSFTFLFFKKMKSDSG